MQNTSLERPVHGHHKLAAAVFVGSLILSAAIVLAAELVKPERYEFHASSDAMTYIIYDRDTGRATTSAFNSDKPTASLAH